MKTPITPEALIEMGFKDTSKPDYSTLINYTYSENDLIIEVYGDNNVDISINGFWHQPNATAIEDIKDLIRLFK
jgi:uridine kinase